MTRIVAVMLLVGALAIGLAACSQGNENDFGNEDGSVSAVESTGDNNADANIESVETQGNESAEEVTDEQTPSVVSAVELEDENQRGPLSILGNADFTADNGVISGAGTKSDPYIIAGWEIVVPAGEYYGVRIENVSAQFVLRGVSIRDAKETDGAGIRIGFTSGGTIEGCSVSRSMNGIDIVSSSDVVMENCALSVSGRGLRVVGESEDQYRHEIADSNLYNGNPIYYFYGLDGETISDLTGGHLTVAGSRNVTLSHNEMVNGDGLLLAFVEDSTVTLNVVHRTTNVTTEHGISLYESYNNVITENGIKNNRWAGIQLTLSGSNTISNNEILVNDIGIRLLASDENDVFGNVLISNVGGIVVLGGASENRIRENLVIDNHGNMTQGIVVEIGMSNVIERNLVFGSETGVILDAQAFSNSVTENTVVLGGYGLSISGSNNVIERNLFAQHSNGILFPESFQRSTVQGNTFRGNVLVDNGSHVYTSMDSAGNRFTENVFLNDGRALVADHGANNVWTVDGRGNFWGFDSSLAAEGDGVDDTAPLASVDARELGLGIVGTLELETVNIETDSGDLIEVPAYTASKAHERATGFRGFPSELIAGFPGILFVFEDEIETSFTMASVLFDLDIAFFNADGEWVGGAGMVSEATTVYTASSPFKYALELPSGTMEELGIAAGCRLVLP